MYVAYDGTPQPVRYYEVNGLAVVGGDMVIGTHADMQQRNAIFQKLQAGQVNSLPVQFSQKISLSEAIGKSKAMTPLSLRIAVKILGWGTIDTIWPSRVIPYEIDASIPAGNRQDKIRQAVEIWS